MDAIVAVSKNWGIGKDNDLLFSIPEDMAFFRETTKGGTVIMGRATLLSLPAGKPLKNRRNIVLSTREGFEVPEAEVAKSPEAAIELAGDDERVFVIGGASVYRQMLPFCDRVYVTLVDAEPEADCFFPNLDRDPQWERSEIGPEKIHKELAFRFSVYRRKK